MLFKYSIHEFKPASICHTPLFVTGDVPLHSVVRSINIFQSPSQHALTNPLIKPPIIQEWFHFRKTHFPKYAKCRCCHGNTRNTRDLGAKCQVPGKWTTPRHSPCEPRGWQIRYPPKHMSLGPVAVVGEQVEKKLRMVPGTLFGLTVPSVFFWLGEDGRHLDDWKHHGFLARKFCDWELFGQLKTAITPPFFETMMVCVKIFGFLGCLFACRLNWHHGPETDLDDLVFPQNHSDTMEAFPLISSYWIISWFENVVRDDWIRVTRMFQLLFGLKIWFVNLHRAREMWRVGKKMRQGPCWNCRLDKFIGFASGHNKMRIMQIRICTTILYWLEYTEDTCLIFNLTKHVFWKCIIYIYIGTVYIYMLITLDDSGWLWLFRMASYIQ